MMASITSKNTDFRVSTRLNPEEAHFSPTSTIG